MGTRPQLIRMSIRVDVAKKVKVRAYTRIRNGRIQKVRSHYRSYLEVAAVGTMQP